MRYSPSDDYDSVQGSTQSGLWWRDDAVYGTDATDTDTLDTDSGNASEEKLADAACLVADNNNPPEY